MKHTDEKAFWLVKVIKVMKWNDKSDAPFGVGILPSLAPAEINGSPVEDRSPIRLNLETLAQRVGWISETPSTKIICDNRMNAGG